MLSQEFHDPWNDNMGDYWSIANRGDRHPLVPAEGSMNAVAGASQRFSPWRPNPASAASACGGRTARPSGAWTSSSWSVRRPEPAPRQRHVVMVLAELPLPDERRRDAPHQRRIRSQSEAAEVYFKDIEIQPIQAMPSSTRRSSDRGTLPAAPRAVVRALPPRAPSGGSGGTSRSRSPLRSARRTSDASRDG